MSTPGAAAVGAAEAAGGPELTFSGAQVSPASGTVVPAFDLRFSLDCAQPYAIRHVLLTTAVSIVPARRAYDAATQERLAGIFGEPSRWATTMRPLEWVRDTTVVPAFTGSATVTVRLPCSYDFDLATTTYLHAVSDGELTLQAQFSGTAFYSLPPDGRLRTAQLPWHHELNATVASSEWHELMRRYYREERWVRLGEDTFDRLADYRSRQAMTSWDETVRTLMKHAPQDEATWTP